MLLPQNVSNTKNVYYATMAVLYNILINKKENGVSNQQIIEGIKDYIHYKLKLIYK